MKTQIASVNFPLTDSLRSHIERRLRFALSLGEQKINRVNVRLSDVNGPRGGVDKCCQLQIVVSGMGDVVVKDIEADMYAAIAQAANRAGRTIRRRLSRRRYLSTLAGRNNSCGGTNGATVDTEPDD
jgi:ribosome-associated translation inhibitor RaiA